jgi:hypothetical protein
MNDHDLITAVRDSFTDVHSATPVERIVSRSRAIRNRRRVPALAATLAVTAAAAVVVTSLIAGPAAGGGTAHSLRARLLAAIDAARGDILMSYGPPGPHSGYELIYPWYPRPGQQVRFSSVGYATDGKLFTAAARTFTMPAGQSAPPISPVTGTATFAVTGTFIVVYPASHAWGEWHHANTVFEMPVDAAGIRHQLATGRFKIIKRTVVDGHKAIELGMTGLNPSKTGLHTTADLLWVDAASYLPLREVLSFSTGRQDIADFKFLPPAAANLAKLRIVIPPGYHRTWLRPGQSHHKVLTPGEQAQQQRKSLAFVACMHRHGFPQFPDGWSGNIGQLISAGINPNSPQLSAALTTCGPW